jgi:hypothetical protein
MEITIDTLISILGLFLGGGAGAFFTWRWQRKKAKAEAEKEEQGYYQQMMKDIAQDRDYYKQERDEYRKTIKSYDERIDDLERKVARNGRIVESLRPFICTDLKCKLRHRAVISDNGEIEEAKKPKINKESSEIEPINNTEL